MLAVVKEPRIELSLSGSKDSIDAILELLRSRYSVEVLVAENAEEDGEKAEDVFASDFWQQTTPGDILAGYRLKHNLTQKELAARCGTRQAVISDYENNRRKLTRKAAIKIGAALGESPDKFLLK